MSTEKSVPKISTSANGKTLTTTKNIKKGRFHNTITQDKTTTYKSTGTSITERVTINKLNTRGILSIFGLIIAFLLLFSLIDDIYNQGANSQKYTFTGLLNFLQSFSQKNWTLDLSFISIPQITAEWVGFEWLKSFFNMVTGTLNSAVSFVSLAVNMLITVLRFMYMLSNYIFNTNYIV